MQNTVVVENLGKRYKCYHAERPNTIMEAALSCFKKMRHTAQFWALRHVSFTVFQGGMLGIIGENGAGKSTLLRLIGGIGRADEGSIETKGIIRGLLELGVGFHGDLTGRENVNVGGVIAGLTRKEVSKRFDSIVEFAELEVFIDNPLRTYSTGMQMRLAFSVAIHTNPEILLVDEVLSVGDMAFQEKCLNQIRKLKKDGCTIVLVSHDVTLIERLCENALLLQHGQVINYGSPVDVIETYIDGFRNEG